MLPLAPGMDGIASRTQRNGLQIGGHHLVPVGEAHHRGELIADDAGVAHQHVDALVGAEHAEDHAAHVRFLRDIGLEAGRAAAAASIACTTSPAAASFSR